MNISFPKSSVQSIYHPIDCRRLDLSLRYYFMDQSAVSKLTQKILEWIQETTEASFAFRWHEGKKTIQHKRVMHMQSWPINEEMGFRLGFDAYVKNPVTSNAAQILQYQKSLQTIYPQYLHHLQVPPFASDCSIDYPEFFDTLFPEKRLEDSQIIENVLKIFYAQNRKYLSFHMDPDFSGHINATAYVSHPGLYYGSARISFSAFCLDALVDRMADMLAEFACELSKTFVQLNVQVSLQPRGDGGDSPYMRYFGGVLEGNNYCREARCLPEELYPSYYLRGVEWLNILSPLTNQNIGSEKQADILTDVETSMLSSGAMLVRSTKPITEYASTDSLSLKRIVLPVLYPGKAAFPLRGIYPWKGTSRVYAWCPRKDWAVVPVEESEVDIIGTDLVFCARNVIA